MGSAAKSRIVDVNGNHLRIVHNDGWENIITGHRTTRDKTTGTRIQPVAPNTDRQTVEDIYHGDDLGARIVDELVGDMMRKWIRLTVSMADDAEADDAGVPAENAVQEGEGIGDVGAAGLELENSPHALEPGRPLRRP